MYYLCRCHTSGHGWTRCLPRSSGGQSTALIFRRTPLRNAWTQAGQSASDASAQDFRLRLQWLSCPHTQRDPALWPCCLSMPWSLCPTPASVKKQATATQRSTGKRVVETLGSSLPGSLFEFFHPSLHWWAAKHGRNHRRVSWSPGSIPRRSRKWTNPGHLQLMAAATALHLVHVSIEPNRTPNTEAILQRAQLPLK